jgi:hypothetical protein
MSNLFRGTVAVVACFYIATEIVLQFNHANIKKKYRPD